MLPLMKKSPRRLSFSLLPLSAILTVPLYTHAQCPFFFSAVGGAFPCFWVFHSHRFWLTLRLPLDSLSRPLRSKFPRRFLGGSPPIRGDFASLIRSASVRSRLFSSSRKLIFVWRLLRRLPYIALSHPVARQREGGLGSPHLRLRPACWPPSSIRGLRKSVRRVGAVFVQSREHTMVLI